MYNKSHNTEIMMGNEAYEIIERLFESLLQNYKKKIENQGEEESLFLMVSIYCITIFKNRFEKWWIIYRFS